MTQTDNPINSIKIHLGDLLEGTVSAWGVVAEVTVNKDQVEALVVPADGSGVQVIFREEPGGNGQWVLASRDARTGRQWRRSYPSAMTMLRGLRAELAPDHPAFGLVFTPSLAGS